MHGILVAIDNYDALTGSLPPAILRSSDGEPIHSWRFLVCRLYLGDRIQVSFYGQDASAAYDSAWDSPGNARYFTGPHRDYPESPNSFIADSDQHTRFVAITGPGTAFDERRSIRLQDLDGDTILVLECATPCWHWMRPGGDLRIADIGDSGKVSEALGPFDDGDFLVGFADGEAWTLSQDMPLRTLKEFMLVESAKSVDRDDMLSRYCIRSFRRTRR